jgi:hypothetical protein
MSFVSNLTENLADKLLSKDACSQLKLKKIDITKQLKNFTQVENIKENGLDFLGKSNLNIEQKIKALQMKKFSQKEEIESLINNIRTRNSIILDDSEERLINLNYKIQQLKDDKVNLQSIIKLFKSTLAIYSIAFFTTIKSAEELNQNGQSIEHEEKQLIDSNNLSLIISQIDDNIVYLPVQSGLDNDLYNHHLLEQNNFFYDNLDSSKNIYPNTIQVKTQNIWLKFKSNFGLEKFSLVVLDD